MSENLDLVRSLYTAWERGDFRATDWAAPDIEYVVADGPEPGRFRGIEGMAEYGRGLLKAWEDWRVEAEEFRLVEDDLVLVLERHVGRGRTSGVEVGHMGGSGASLFRLRDGKVSRLVVYWDRRRAFAELGLQG